MSANIKAVIQRALKGLRGPARRAAYYNARARAFQAAGLRSDGVPLAPTKPCGCQNGCCLKCSKEGNKLYYSAAEVAQFHADYMSGMSLAAVAKKYGTAKKGLKGVFVRRGLFVRPMKGRLPEFDPVTGRRLPVKPKSWAEIRAIARERAMATLEYQNTIAVPAALKPEWKKQTMAWRQRVIAILREESPVLNPRPTTPFSSNVAPFEYGTPEAMAIMDRLNEGLTSQKFKCRIWVGSVGVIYHGTLYFWTGHAKRQGESTGYLSGSYLRALLHHVIWAQHHQRQVPAKHTVIFLDGNRNNFAPANLALRSMADCARMNSVPNRLKQDPRNPVLLAKFKLRNERILATRATRRARKSRAQMAVLVQGFENKNSGGVLAALNQRRK